MLIIHNDAYPGGTASQTSCEDAFAGKVIKAMRAQEGVVASEYLQAIRAGAYDEPFQPTWMARTGLRAYLLRYTGVETMQGERPVVHTSTGRQEVLALLDPAKSRTYLLRGSRDPVGGFNSLVHDLGLKCGSEEPVVALLWIFVDIVSGDGPNMVQTPYQARWAVEGYRLRRSGDTGLKGAIDQWWAANEESLRQLAPPKVTRSGAVTMASFYLARDGTVVRQELQVGNDCTVTAGPPIRITSSLLPSGESESRRAGPEKGP
jgi:hypothetical protein